MSIENEKQVVEFIEAIFRRDHLRREFRRVYESIDALTADLNKDAEQILLVNLRSYLDESAAELDVAEQTVDALLPHARAYRGMLELHSKDEEADADATGDTLAPDTPPPPSLSGIDVRGAQSFDARPIGPQIGGAVGIDPYDESPPDRPTPFDDLPLEMETTNIMHVIEEKGLREEDMLFWLNGSETDVS
jgi:hypothetical protein